MTAVRLGITYKGIPSLKKFAESSAKAQLISTLRDYNFGFIKFLQKQFLKGRQSGAPKTEGHGHMNTYFSFNQPCLKEIEIRLSILPGHKNKVIIKNLFLRRLI